MAFGRGSSTGVARADVEFRAETGKFEADVTAAKNIYNRAVDSMSDETLRMSVAQEKLDRAISRFGPESLQARTAAVNYRRELTQLRHEEDRVSRSARRASNEITRVGRGSIAASGAFKGLGNALFFASGAFAGGFGIIYALRTTIQAAGRAEVSVAKLAQAVRNSGNSWEGNRQQVLAAVDAHSKLSAFDDEELQDTLGALIIRTGDVNQALKLNALSADVARARNVSLDAAMRLVLRASLGQTASLRRLGIDVQKVTTEQDKLRASGVKVTFEQRQQAKLADERATQLSVIAQLEAKFAGQSERYARTSAGRQEYFNKVLEDTQEIIGTALLPTVNDLLTRLTEWLDKANKTGDVQKEVNRILDDLGGIVGGVADAFRTAKTVLDPFVDKMGGLHNTAKALTILWLAFKAKALASFIATTAASLSASTQGVAHATAFGRAWDYATRPRYMTVTTTTTGGGIPGAPGGPGGIPPAGRGTLRERIGQYGKPVAPARTIGVGSAVGGITVVALLASILGPDWLKGPKLLSQNEIEALKKAAKSGKLRMIDVDRLEEEGVPSLHINLLRKLVREATPKRSPGEGRVGGPDVLGRPGELAPTPRGPGGGGGGTPRRTAVDIQLDLDRATAQNNENAEIRYHQELANLYQRQANNLERRKNLTLLQKQKLSQLYNQIASEEGAIESIREGRRSEARARSAAAAQAARERHTRVKERLATQEQRLENALLRAAAREGLQDDREAAAALIAFYRAAAKNDELTARERQQFEKKRLQVGAKVRAARAKGLESRLDIKERKLRNAVEAAELKDGIKDDEIALKRLIAFYRAEEKNMDLAQKARLEATRKRIEAQKKLKKLKEDDEKKGGVESGAAFLAGLQGVLNTYGGNLFAPGELNVRGRHPDAATAHTIIQTNLLRQQNRVLNDLSSQTRSPGSRAGYTNMTSLFDGYAT